MPTHNHKNVFFCCFFLDAQVSLFSVYQGCLFLLTVMKSTGGERSENPSAVYLQSAIQTATKTWQETAVAWNRLDSPTAGSNINTPQGTRQWHGYL